MNQLRYANFALKFSFSFLVILSCLVPVNSFAQDFPPKPSQWVMDYANLLNASEQQQINNLLQAYEDSTSNQIVVAIFKSAQGYSPEQFTIQLAEKWKVGQKGRDNGIILAVFLEERNVRAEVGYGLEDVIPDAYAFQVVQNVIPPYFKKGEYFQGIYQGCLALISAAAGKYKALPKKHQGDDGFDLPWALLAFLAIVFFTSLGRRRRSRATVGSRGWRHSGPFFLGGFFGSSGGGGFGGFGGGGGGFSAGGGSFGGGGATGSW